MSHTSPLFSRTQVLCLGILPVVWVGVMFATFAVFHAGGRTPVMEARLVAGLLVSATLWLWLRQSGRPAARLMGWHVDRDDWPVSALVLVLGLVTLWPLLRTENLASLLQPALVEETLFRGFVFGVVSVAVGPVRALWWSAALFGALHVFEGVGTALGSMVAGFLLLGTARLATGNVVAPIVMHAVMNANQPNMALLIWVVAVLGSGLRRARRKGDLPSTARDRFLQLGRRLEATLGHAWLAWPVAFEWQLWNFRRPLREDGVCLNQPRASTLPGLLQALMALLVLEGVAVHLMVRALGSAGAAYAIGAAEVFSLCWLYAFRRQLLLRSTVLHSDRLIVRTGLLWTAEIPRTQVAAAELLGAQRQRGGRNLSPMQTPNVRLHLHDPVVCRSLWGWPVGAHQVIFHVQTPEQVIAWSAGLAGNDGPSA